MVEKLLSKSIDELRIESEKKVENVTKEMYKDIKFEKK